jgi:hypothetical protein
MEKNYNKVYVICVGNRFNNVKAIRGHIKSHLVKLPIPPEFKTNNQTLDNSVDLTQHQIQCHSSHTCHPKNKYVISDLLITTSLPSVQTQKEKMNLCPTRKQTHK